VGMLSSVIRPVKNSRGKWSLPKPHEATCDQPLRHWLQLRLAGIGAAAPVFSRQPSATLGNVEKKTTGSRRMRSRSLQAARRSSDHASCLGFH
jgi:hypothetical protein